MKTSRLSGQLAGALALCGLALPLTAQQCDQGPPECTDGGVPNLAAMESGETVLGTFPVSDSVEVAQYNPADYGGKPLVAVTLTLEFSTTGDISYTNNTSANCPLTTWSHDTTITDVDSPDAPLCVDFPLAPQLISRSGSFTNTPSGATAMTFLPPDGLCGPCPSGSPVVRGPFKDAGNLAAFTGNGSVTFDISASATFGCFGCNPGECAADVDLIYKVTVTYYNCDVQVENGCVCLGPSPHYRIPGSMLLFPEFDNREGDVTVVTVTNVDCTLQSGDVDVEYIYIDKDTCDEFNRTETLTPCDTLTVLTNFHNPQDEQGYLYVFAKDSNDRPIVHNNLIGNLLVISGFESFDYSVNPVAFRGVGSNTGIIQPDGTLTDLDNDGNRDLDGLEYEPAPDVITVPRFLGQDTNPGPGLFQSQLIVIALSGGAEFLETRIDCLLYNDNEQAFSFEYAFYCWDKPFLRDLTFAFSNDFLKTTDHDPAEIIGAPGREAGWLCCDGGTASSSQETIMDPAFYMVLVERVGNFGVADLPFECGTQPNGALLPRDLLGDGDPTPVDGDNQ